jgi:hypothetical protein
MEAPEKIYIFENPILDFTKLSVKQNNNDIEYTRTDAFIEKACAWLEEHMIGWNNDFVKDFRKYMEGE